MQTFHHWHWHQDSSQVLWIEFDREGKSANTINSDVLEEFGQILGLIADLSEVKQVVICSKKRTGFIAGADILDVFASQDLEKTKTLIERGQKVFDQLQNLPMPTIALIHGFCLGGGFELALACDWRIVIDSPQVRIGLPEVQLGLQPGWGGSVRLMRLIGVKRTFELILSGKMLKAHQAKRMQIIDEVIAERLTPEILNHYVQKRPKMRCRWDWLWKISFARVVFGQMIRKQIQQKANKEFYPAPFAMIQNWEELGHHNDTSFQREIDSIYQLAQTSTAKNLVRVFGLKDANKKTMAPSSVEIRHVHVVGAGIMGGDIAAWIALKGYTVTLQDVNPKQLSYALNRASKIFSRQCTQPFDIQRCMDRLIIDQAGEGLKNADVIIEAVTEQLALKLEILKNIEKNSRKDAIIATNTSTISLENMDHVFKNPKRFVGIHFFNPVPLMPLVEIVIGNLTGDEAIHAAHHFVQKIDKIAIKVKSAPGFFVNRVLLPYMLEAMLLVEEGYRLEQVDKAATDFGMPMGPIELADTVGLDVCLAALSSMNLTTDCVSAHLQRRIQQGHLGKKTGKGFYEYSKNKAIKREEKYFSDRDFCQNRLIYALCNEAVSALEQGIVSSEDDADLASLFGFGFPPFRGGIIHYIRETGVESLLKRFEKIIQKSKNLSSGWHSLSLEK